jgi:ankyrin repeat protein
MKFQYELEELDSSGDSLVVRIIKRKLGGQLLAQLENIRSGLADRDSFGATVLHYAAIMQSQTLCQALKFTNAVNSTDKDGLTPLGYATRAGDQKGIPCLITGEAKAAARSPRQGQLEKAHRWVNYVGAREPIYGDPDVVDKFGMTPCIYAIMSKTTDLCPFSDRTGTMRYTIDLPGLLAPRQLLDSEREIYDYATDATTLKPCAVQLTLFAPAYRDSLDSEGVRLLMKKSPVLSEVSLLHLVVLLGKSVDLLVDVQALWPDLLNAQDGLGRAPIHWAVIMRRGDFVAALINMQPNLLARDSDGNTLYHFVDDVNIYGLVFEPLSNLSLGIDIANNLGETPIHTACQSGAAGPLKLFASQADAQVLVSLDKAGMAPLDYALAAHSDDCIAFLHAHGVENRLVSAIDRADMEMVGKLIGAGYPVNSCDQLGMTPLSQAALNGDYDMCVFLLRKRANLNTINQAGQSPIHIAAEGQHPRIVRLLLQHNFDLCQFRVSQQPYLLCRERPERKFLYFFWKRQYVGAQFLAMLTQAEELIQVVDQALTNLLDATPKTGKLPALIEEAQGAMRMIRFISSTMKSVAKTFNYYMPVHHIFLVMKTFNSAAYLAAWQECKKSWPELLNKAPTSMSQVEWRAVLAFPMRWSQTIFEMICRWHDYLIEEIDDAALFEAFVVDFRSTIDRFTPELNVKADQLRELEHRHCNPGGVLQARLGRGSRHPAIAVSVTRTAALWARSGR